MQQTATSSLNDKGYLLIPYQVRRALNLKPRQLVTMRIRGDRKVELEPMKTISEVFALTQPSNTFSLRKLKAEKKLAREAIAANASSEGL